MVSASKCFFYFRINIVFYNENESATKTNMDGQDVIMENKATNKFKCIFVIVTLWVVLILYIVTMISEKSDKNLSQNLDSRQHQSSSNSENHTNVTRRLIQLELSRDHSEHYMYRCQFFNEDVFFFSDTGMLDISNPGSVSGRI